MEKKNKKEIIRAIKFTIISISAGLIQIGSYTLFLEIFKFEVWLSNILSLALSVIWNFTINRKITFKSSANVPKAMLLVFLFYLAFTPLSALFSKNMTEKINPYLIEGIVMLSNFILEFLYTRFIVYRNTCDTMERKK